MDKQHWPGPVWISRLFPLHSSHARFTYPDCENAALGVVTEPVSQPGACHNTKFSFTRPKDIDAEFPLEKTLPFAYPLLQPRHYTVVEHSSAGNCLDTMILGGQNLVVHPVRNGNESQELSLSQLIPGSYDDTRQVESDNFFNRLKKVTAIPIEQGIQQLICQEVCNNGYILCQSENEVQLFGVLCNDGDLKTITYHSYQDSVTTDVALSDVFPGMSSVACADGQVYLYDTAGQKPLWDAHLSKSKFIEKPKYQIDFGDHPQSLLAGNESSVWLCDTRIPVSHSNHRTPSVQSVFSVDDIKNKLPNCEKVYFFKQVYGQSFIYVVTRDCMYLIDLRNDSMPVLQWQHMMRTRPSFFNTHRTNNKDIVMITNEYDHNVCMMVNEWIPHDCIDRCQGIGLPKHFVIDRDTADFGHKHNLLFSHQVVERLSVKLTGIATFNNHSSNNKFSFLSLYANGDIFSQDLHLINNDGNYNSARDDYLKAVERGQDILRHWEEQVGAAKLKGLNKQDLNYYSATSFFENLLKTNETVPVNNTIESQPTTSTGTGTSNRLKFLKRISGIIKPGPKRPIKKTLRKNVWNIKDGIKYFRRNRIRIKYQQEDGKNLNIKLLDQYWLHNLINGYISEMHIPIIPEVEVAPDDAATEYLPEQIAKALRDDNLRKCRDPLASKILSLWLEDKTNTPDLASTSGRLKYPNFEFRCAPFNTRTLTCLPSKFQQDRELQNESENVNNVSGLDISELNDTQYIVPDLNITDLIGSHSQETIPFSQESQTPSEKPKVKSKKKKRKFDGF